MNPFKLLLLVPIFFTCSRYVYPAEEISQTAKAYQSEQATEELSPQLVPALEDVQIQHATQDESRLTRYKDMYFIVGKPDTKIQISFKYLIIKSMQIYVSYSQLMVWKLFNQTE